MKHKHAEVIKAWADGSQVQVKWDGVDWQDSKDPVWFTEWEYRIKPSNIQETNCAECGVKASDGFALYCVKCSEPMRLKTLKKKWVNLKKSEMMKCYSTCFTLESFDVPKFYKLIEAKLKEKNNE
jgi:hypothetical protein